MGMFDYLDVKFPLPMPKDPMGFTGVGSCGFQTKDLENCLSTYQIREDGSVWLKKVKNKYVPGNPDDDSLLGRLGHVEPISSKWVLVEHLPKTIEFYDYQQTRNGNYDYYIVYVATVVKGKVKRVKIKTFEATENSSRKAREAIWEKEHEERAKFCNTWYYKYILSYWNKFICKLEKKLHKFLTYVSSNMYIVSRKLKF